jgi:hypothetical protein
MVVSVFDIRCLTNFLRSSEDESDFTEFLKLPNIHLKNKKGLLPTAKVNDNERRKIMKKTVLVLAVLMLAVPVMAGVTITPAQVGATNVIQVSYTATDGNIPRAFALDVRMSPANGTPLAPYDFNPNFYVAPGTFSYVGGVTTWGTPFVGPNTVGFTTEMGSLWATSDVNHPTQPPSTGVLFRFKVDHCCHIVLTENAQRGGVVMESTAVTFPPGYVTLNDCNVCGWSDITISGKVVGNKPPKTSGIGGVTISATGAAPISTNGDGTYSVTVFPPYTGTVTASDPNAQWDFNTPGPLSRSYVAITTNQINQDFNGTALECLNARDPGYTNWVFLGKRPCWCFKKQCYGDTDNKASLGKYVVLADLATLKACLGKTVTTLKGLMPTEPNNICADFDHKASLSKPCTLADLTILKAWLGKTGVPDCNTTYINAWKP